MKLKFSFLQLKLKGDVILHFYWYQMNTNYVTKLMTPKPTFPQLKKNKSKWLYVLVMSRTRFRVNPHSIVAWMSRNSLLEAGAKSEV